LKDKIVKPSQISETSWIIIILLATFKINMTILNNREVKLIQLTAENNPVLALAPPILSLSEPLPFVKKTKLPSILTTPEKYLQPLDIVKIKKHNRQIK